jgi:hypothetical protein
MHIKGWSKLRGRGVRNQAGKQAGCGWPCWSQIHVLTVVTDSCIAGWLLHRHSEGGARHHEVSGHDVVHLTFPAATLCTHPFA